MILPFFCHPELVSGSIKIIPPYLSLSWRRKMSKKKRKIWLFFLLLI